MPYILARVLHARYEEIDDDDDGTEMKFHHIIIIPCANAVSCFHFFSLHLQFVA